MLLGVAALGVEPRGDARASAPAMQKAEAAPLPAQQILRRALRANPAQEYFLYIPSRGARGAPLFVAVHGISRNAKEHATLFAPYAEKHGVVLLAPYFTERQHGDYQRLGRAGHGPRADLALDGMVAEVAELTGASVERLYLFGFSGGAQFAHRYAMAHPERVARAVVGAAGWYTFPDPQTPYPYGIGPDPDLANVRFEPDKFLRVPIAVMVGEKDVTDENLRRNPEVDRQQGVTRLERARNWVEAMREAAAARRLEPLVTYESVPGIRHSFNQFMMEGELGDRVFLALFGQVPERVPVAAPAGGRP
jgi:pimeloyl-ACP methyl ester carboxylesterase